ncbi:MAG: ABC transporter permease [Metamycoplasmataceae bacterium]
MFKYLIKRISLAIITLICLITIIYLLVASFSKNPFAGNSNLDAADQLYKDNGLDRPILIRFFEYISDLFHGNFGKIYVPTGGEQSSIPNLFFSSLKWSVLITLPSLVLSSIFGLGLGILAGYKRGTWIDGIISIFVITFVGLPAFVIAPIMIIIATQTNGLIIFDFLLPEDYGWWLTIKSLMLPILTVTLGSLASYTILARNQIVSILSSNHVLIAKSKGLNNWEIFTKHILRNISIPIVSFLLPSFVSILAGNIIIEQFFRVPGASNIIVNAFPNGEINVVMFSIVFFTSLSLLLQIILDFLYILIDPRIKFVENNKNDVFSKIKNTFIRKQNQIKENNMKGVLK